MKILAFAVVLMLTLSACADTPDTSQDATPPYIDTPSATPEAAGDVTLPVGTPPDISSEPTREPIIESTSEPTPTVITSRYETPSIEWAIERFSPPEENWEDAIYLFVPEIVYPISYITEHWGAPYSDCVFIVHGFYGAELPNKGEYSAPSRYMINAIEIIAPSSGYYQLIEGMETEAYASDNYGFQLLDFTGDGIYDIKLFQHRGGSMRNEPSYFWLWDSETGMYVENEQLGRISGGSTVRVTDDGLVSSYTRDGAYASYFGYYEYQDGEFVMVESEVYTWETVDDVTYQILENSRLIDGEWVTEVTREALGE